MKWLEYVLFILLIFTIVFGIKTILDIIPGQTVSYTQFEANISLLPKSGAVQFYPFMRYSSPNITYSIEEACSQAKADSIKKALEIISANTSLRFIESNDGQITYTCSQIAPAPEQAGHFVAGEGGPTKIINSTVFSVILKGQVSLYRPEKCATPNIAIHETLHALGFDHVQDNTDIMYPVTDCNKEIKPMMINAINKLYSYPSLPDLGIDYVSANQTGKYLNFHITITNHGLVNSRASNLTLYSDSKPIKVFDLGAIPVGNIKFLDVQNMHLEDKLSAVQFAVQATDGQGDLFANNNIAEINLVYAQ